MEINRIARIALSRITLNAGCLRIYDRVHERWFGALRLGARGELAAERFLLRHGWIVIERGYENRGGEIDLIAVDGRTVVFVEVKTRSSDAKGHPAEAVDQQKQAHIASTAYGYLKKQQLTECAVRFDVIAVIWPDVRRSPTIEHIRDAFEPPGRFQLV